MTVQDQAVRPLIDDEFRELLPPLAPEEHDRLAESLQSNGCREPLIVWAETGKLLDGHNRLGICEDLGIDYEAIGVPLKTRRDALLWIIDNQFGRRNLTPIQRKYLLGRRYSIEKGEPSKAPDRPQSEAGDEGRTRERIAKEAHVSPATIERAEKLSQAIDATTKRVGAAFHDAALGHEIRLTDADFADLASREDITTMEGVEAFAEERAAARKPRPSTSAEMPFVTVTVSSWTTTTCPETGEEIIDTWLLGCGHEVPAAKRVVAAGTHQKTRACPECGSGTRTPFDRRKRADAWDASLTRAFTAAHRHHWHALAQSAILLATLGPMDARQAEIRAKVTEAARALGLLEGA